MMRIVVVDDNQLSLKRVESLLQPLGYEVLSFTGAEAALQLLSLHPVNLVLVDLAMPIHSGYDLMAAMKRQKINARTVVVSGKNKDEDIKKALQMGAQDYILKPYDDDFFIAKVKLALQSQANTAEAQFAEAIFDEPTQLQITLPQISVSETGFFFETSLQIPKGTKLDFKSRCLDEMNLGGARLSVTSCTEIQKGNETLYRTFVSFVGLNQAQLTDVRLWVRQQQLKYRKT